MSNKTGVSHQRFVPLKQVGDIFELHFGIRSCDLTLRARMNAWKIPRIKANPHARRGGGPAYYSVHHIERKLQALALPGRLQPVEAEVGR